MKQLLVLIFLLVGTTVLLSADVVYTVNVTTATYAGSSGFLDFQLGRGATSQAANVTIQNIATDGTLDATSIQRTGAVNGSLPGQVTLSNTQQFNDYFQSLVYGSTLQFTLAFSGPAVNQPGSSNDGSPFVFGLYNASQLPVGQNDGFGNALLIEINPNGTTTATTYTSIVSLATTAVPEPKSLALLTGGLPLCAFVLRRFSRQSR